MSSKFPRLFERGQIGRVTLRNRVVMAPMVTNFADSNGGVTDRIVEHYRAKARGGVGLIIVEAAAVQFPESVVAPSQLFFHDDAYLAGHYEIVEAVHDWGTKVFLQIHHGGVQTTPANNRGHQPVGPSDVPCPLLGGQPRGLTYEEVKATIASFAKAAARAKMAGYDGIELHGGHGYFISEFMSPYFNKRTDHYGGTFERRMNLPLEVIEACRQAVGDDFPICYRFSVDEFLPGGRTLEDSKMIAPMLEEAGIDCLHATCGTYGSVEHFLESSFHEEGWRMYLSEEMKKVLSKIPVIAVGMIKTPEFAEKALAAGQADFIAMGRAFLADAEWTKKAKEGRSEEINRCISCNIGCTQRAVYDGKGLRCTVNPVQGRETRYGDIRPADKPKRVMVVGAGPGGMEAAMVAASRGHQVTLHEKTGSLGGQLPLASATPHKRQIAWFSEYLTMELSKNGVDIRLNSEVTAAVVQAEKPDVVILATGSGPMRPAIPGAQSSKTLDAWDVLSGKSPLENKEVVIVGGGMVGCETAIFLADAGCDVTILEVLDSVAITMDVVTKKTTLNKLKEQNVKLLPKQALVEITDEGAVIQDRRLRKQVLECDAVVLAMGAVSDRALADELDGRGYDLYVIGDCEKPGQIIDAVYDGFRVAAMI